MAARHIPLADALKQRMRDVALGHDEALRADFESVLHFVPHRPSSPNATAAASAPAPGLGARVLAELGWSCTKSFELICVVTLGSARREGLRRLRGARRIFTQRQRGGQQQHRIAPKPAAGAALCPPSPCRGGRRGREGFARGSSLSRSVFFLFWQRIGREERKRGREKLPRRG